MTTKKRWDYVKRYRLKNRVRLSQVARSWYLKNRVRILRNQKVYYQENREKIAERQREFGIKNRHRIREYYRGYCLKYPERVKARHDKYLKTVKERAFTLVGRGKIECFECHISDIRVLNINHVNGGGGKERLIIQSGLPFYIAIASGHRSIHDLNILCCNCNRLHHISSSSS